MIFSVDMTVLAVLALIAGLAAFIAPRLLGIVAGIGLVLFAVVQLFPEIQTVDPGQALSKIELGALRFTDSEPGRNG